MTYISSFENLGDFIEYFQVVSLYLLSYFSFFIDHHYLLLCMFWLCFVTYPYVCQTHGFRFHCKDWLHCPGGVDGSYSCHLWMLFWLSMVRNEVLIPNQFIRSQLSDNLGIFQLVFKLVFNSTMSRYSESNSKANILCQMVLDSAKYAYAEQTRVY